MLRIIVILFLVLPSVCFGKNSNFPLNHRAWPTQKLKNSNYAYAPNIIYTEDGVYHCVYGADSYINPNGRGGDKICYTRSYDFGKTWTKHKVLHYSDYIGEYHHQTHDPAVIYYPPENKWYLYYGGSYGHREADNTVSAYKTLIFVARSDRIDGPYETLTVEGWSTDKTIKPKPIIQPFNVSYQSQKYGAGQPSVYYGEDEKIHLWYREDSDDPDHPQHNGKSKIYKVESIDSPVDFGSPEFTGVIDAVSVEVKNDMSRHRMVMINVDNQHGGYEKLVKRYSYDSGFSWTEPEIICDSDNFPDWSNNAGISSDLFGNLLPGVYGQTKDPNSYSIIGYGAPIYPVYTEDEGELDEAGEYKDPCHARWDLFFGRYDVRQDGDLQLTSNEPMVNFTRSWSNSSLWSHTNLIDNNFNSTYSSYSSPSVNNDESNYKVAFWTDRNYPVKSLFLYPRTYKDDDYHQRVLCDSQLYDVYATNYMNTRWKYIGRFESEAMEVEVRDREKDEYFNKVFSAEIEFSDPVYTRGFLIKPVNLGTDKHGVAYFQLAEIDAEVWRECK